MSNKDRSAQTESRKKPSGSRQALWIILNFVWMFVLYQAAIHCSGRLGTMLPYQLCSGVYGAALAVLLVLYWLRTQAPPAGSDTAQARSAAKNERAKPLLVWIFPLAIVLLLDLLDLFVIEYFRQLFSSVL